MNTIVFTLLVLSLSVTGLGESPQTVTQGRCWDPFLDTLQQRTIKWFLEVTPDKTGLTPDRWPSQSFCSIAAVAFALTSYPIGAERNQISRTEAIRRTLATLRFLWSLPQGEGRSGVSGYKGFFYHFINMQTGLREWNCELSTVDTALLLLGILSCQSYFDRRDPREKEIRTLADSLYRRVDWKWAMGEAEGVLMGWTPENRFHHLTWYGYTEGLFVYILAMGSPTHPVPSSAYKHWLSTYEWASHYGYEYVQFAPLFGHQYTQCWIDLRGVKDSYMCARWIDYFENSRRATYSQWNYNKENPKKFRDYADTIWGLTACDGPKDTVFDVDDIKRTFIGYGARGTSPKWSNDDGTLTPAAAGGSLPFAPDICIPALKAMRAKYSSNLWTEYGFRDAFNPTYVTLGTPDGWFDKDYLGIDQGPIVLMIENLRNGFVWELMKKSPYVVNGLRNAGFTGGWLDRRNAPQKHPK
jgi:hypothetical protein